MNILYFIFLLGINFVIFGFIWGIIKFGISAISGGIQKSEQSEYIFRITKYVLLVAVTANFVHNINQETELIHSFTARIIISSVVLGLYLLGKLEKRNQFSQFSAIGGNFINNFTTTFDPKVERFLILGSIAFFVLCLFFPEIVNNGLINWFSSAIQSLSNAFFIGFIFNIIAFFSIISIFMRGSNILGKLISGQPISESFKKNEKSSPFGNMGGFGNGFQNQKHKSTVEEDYNKKASANTDDEGFTEYEDVTNE